MRVTDHALLRWLDRRHGINLDDVRQELAELAQPFMRIGATGFPLCGVWVVTDGQNVVTVLPEKPKPESHARNDRGRRKPDDAPFEGDVRKMLARRARA